MSHFVTSASDNHSRNGVQSICQQKILAWPGISPIFSNARGLPGECSHIIPLEEEFILGRRLLLFFLSDAAFIRGWRLIE